MQALVFRLKLMENARFQVSDDADLATFASVERELRESLITSLAAIPVPTILPNQGRIIHGISKHLATSCVVWRLGLKCCKKPVGAFWHGNCHLKKAKSKWSD
jgi:hypothetical protein